MNKGIIKKLKNQRLFLINKNNIKNGRMNIRLNNLDKPNHLINSNTNKKIKSKSTNKIKIVNGMNKFPSIKYSNYIVRSKENKNTCIYLDTSQKLIEEYWKALALCHDCSIQNGEYIGMSPDNIELVKSASLQVFKFDVSENNTQFLISYLNPETNENIKEQQRFEKLRQIEFS